MSEKKKPLKVRINRKRWLRGVFSSNGYNVLRCEEGKMCCLGFVAVKCRIPADKLVGQQTPEDVCQFATERFMPLLNDEGDGCLSDSKLAERAIEANDDTCISENKRERQVKQILARAGFDIEFFG